MNGSKVVTPVPTVEMVFAGVLVPHQLSAAETPALLLLRFFPTGAEFPARRLKVIVTLPAPVALPMAIPPPLPVVAFPVIVTLSSVVTSVQAPGQPFDPVLVQSPPPSFALGRLAAPALLLLIMELWSINKFDSLCIPPPFPPAWLPEMMLPWITV